VHKTNGALDVETNDKVGIGSKLWGGFCVLVGGLMLIGGIPQLIGALRMVISPSLADSEATDPGRVGYLVGTLLGLVLAFLLVRFGLRRFKPKG